MGKRADVATTRRIRPPGGGRRVRALCAIIGVGWGLLAASLHAVVYVFFLRSPKFSVRTDEIDPSWPIIQLLTRMKLAHPCRTIEEKAIGFRPDSPAVEL
jgi:hypothetical protein